MFIFDITSKMNSQNKLAVIGGAAVLVMDTIAAYTSQQFNIPLVYFSLGSVIIYFCVAYRAAVSWNIRTAMYFGVFLAIIDGTAGWMIAAFVGEHGNGPMSNVSFLVWAITVVVLIGLAVLISGLAGLIAQYRNR
jgi:hypothetical protein